MFKFKLSPKILTLLASLLTSGQIFADTLPKYTVFTYAGDPSSTITVNWQTKSKLSETPSVHYSTISRDQLSSPSEQIILGSSTEIDGVEDHYYHKVHITGLEPNTTYYLN